MYCRGPERGGEWPLSVEHCPCECQNYLVYSRSRVPYHLGPYIVQLSFSPSTILSTVSRIHMEALMVLLGGDTDSTSVTPSMREVLSLEGQSEPQSDPLDVDAIVDELILLGLDDDTIDLVRSILLLLLLIATESKQSHSYPPFPSFTTPLLQIESDPTLYKSAYVLLEVARRRPRQPPSPSFLRSSPSAPASLPTSSLFSLPPSSPSSLSSSQTTPTPSSPLISIQDAPSKPILNSSGRDTVFGFLFNGKVLGSNAPLGTMIPHPPSLHAEREATPKVVDSASAPPPPPPYTLKFDIELPPPQPKPSRQLPKSIPEMEKEWAALRMVCPSSPSFASLDLSLKSSVLLSFKRMLKSTLFQANSSLSKLVVFDDVLVMAASGEVMPARYQSAVRNSVEERITKYELERTIKLEGARLEYLRKKGEARRKELARWEQSKEEMSSARAKILEKYELLMKESEVR